MLTTSSYSFRNHKVTALSTQTFKIIKGLRIQTIVHVNKKYKTYNLTSMIMTECPQQNSEPQHTEHSLCKPCILNAFKC